MSKAKKGGKSAHLDAEQAEEVEERLRLTTPAVYEIIRQEGETELARPLWSLWWSGVAAGLSIGFSIVAEGFLHAYLPETSYRPLIENFGYCLGFLIVIQARQQLFTENTLTAVLPVVGNYSGRSLYCMLRLWIVVFAANGAGTLLFAAFCAFTPALGDELHAAMLELSRHLMENSWWQMLFKGIVAGWLIAALVWILPSCEGSEVLAIILMTYPIAAGGFTHVVAGSVEAFLLLFAGEISILELVFGFTLPVFLGNVAGGTVLFALIAYAQVQEEV